MRAILCLGLVAACHHASREAPPAPADAGHAAPSAYTVTFTTQELGAAGGPLVTTIVRSTGEVTRVVDRPPQRFVGTVARDELAALDRLVVDPALAKAPQSELAGEGVDRWIEIAKDGGLVDLHFGGAAPDAAGPMIALMGKLAASATTIAPAAGFQKLSYDAHMEGVALGPTTTIVVDGDGKATRTIGDQPAQPATASGDVIAALVFDAAVLETLPATEARGEGERVGFAVTRADGSEQKIRFDGGVPIAARSLERRLAALFADASAFDTVTYSTMTAGGTKMGYLKELTVSSDGTLSYEIAHTRAGSAKGVDLTALRAALAKFNDIATEAASGRGERITVTVSSGGSTRSVQLFRDGTGDAKALIAALDALVAKAK